MFKGMKKIIREEEVIEYAAMWNYMGESYISAVFPTKAEAEAYIAEAECPDEYAVEEKSVTVYNEEIECREHDDE